jgi:ParB family chromosome partitioning protein
MLENLSLTKACDIFKSTTSNINSESIVEIPLSELHPPEFHPFQVNNDEAMTRLSENIKRYGVREPGLARPRAEGGYELLCGNRRKRACEIAGITTMPVIVRELDDDSAIIAMVDSNLEQREKILPSEKAWAYRVKMEALNHNGVKSEMHSVDVLVEQTGESKNQIFRLIRLTELVNALLDKVDTKQLAFNPAVELSYLSQAEQTAVACAMEKYAVKPSLSQSQRLKKLKQSGELTVEMIDAILAESKKPTPESKGTHPYRSYFPLNYTARQMDEVISKLLSKWKAGEAV